MNKIVSLIIIFFSFVLTAISDPVSAQTRVSNVVEPGTANARNGAYIYSINNQDPIWVYETIQANGNKEIRSVDTDALIKIVKDNSYRSTSIRFNNVGSGNYNIEIDQTDQDGNVTTISQILPPDRDTDTKPYSVTKSAPVDNGDGTRTITYTLNMQDAEGNSLLPITWTDVDAVGGSSPGDVSCMSGMGYLKDYWVKDYAAPNMAAVYAVRDGWNVRSNIKRYDGQFHRSYVVYDTYMGSQRGVKLFYYDYDQNDFSDAYDIGELAPNLDTHHASSINIDDQGYIYLISNFDDGALRVYKSNYPELNNAGVFDATFTKIQNSIATYSNYSASAFSGNNLVIDWRGNAANSATQEHRALVYSSDGGVTFSAPRDWLALNNNHWAYGTIYPDKYRGGVFLMIGGQNNVNKAYPKWGIVWTRDFVNFGNLNYYRSNGKSGWSKNVVTNGAISDAEFVANVAVINDSWSSNINHYTPELEQLPNGDLVTLYVNGTRSGSLNITEYVVGHYSLTSNTWVHNATPIGNIPTNIASNAANRASITPYDDKNMVMVVRTSTGNADMICTKDGGTTWEFVETISSSGTVNMVNESNFLHSDKEEYIIVQNGTSGFSIMRFGEQKLNNTY